MISYWSSHTGGRRGGGSYCSTSHFGSAPEEVGMYFLRVWCSFGFLHLLSYSTNVLNSSVNLSRWAYYLVIWRLVKVKAIIVFFNCVHQALKSWTQSNNVFGLLHLAWSCVAVTTCIWPGGKLSTFDLDYDLDLNLWPWSQCCSPGEGAHQPQVILPLLSCSFHVVGGLPQNCKLLNLTPYIWFGPF